MEIFQGEFGYMVWFWEQVSRVDPFVLMLVEVKDKSDLQNIQGV